MNNAIIEGARYHNGRISEATERLRHLSDTLVGHQPPQPMPATKEGLVEVRPLKFEYNSLYETQVHMLDELMGQIGRLEDALELNRGSASGIGAGVPSTARY